MKRTLLSVIGAMFLVGMFLIPSTASAQNVGFGVRIGDGHRGGVGVQVGGGHHGRRGGFSIEIYSGDRWHRHPGRGPVWRDRGCGWDYPCDNRRGPVYRGGGRRGGDWGHHDSYRQPETIRVRVTEWVWDNYRRCEVPVQRFVTARYDYRVGDYYYIDSYGYRVWLRDSRGW